MVVIHEGPRPLDLTGLEASVESPNMRIAKHGTVAHLGLALEGAGSMVGRARVERDPWTIDGPVGGAVEPFHLSLDALVCAVEVEVAETGPTVVADAGEEAAEDGASLVPDISCHGSRFVSGGVVIGEWEAREIVVKIQRFLTRLIEVPTELERTWIRSL